jgi:hypothetical protein
MRRPAGPSYNKCVAVERIREWTGWYRFARETLGYSHQEAVAYANVRYVEETNRAAVRSPAA